MRHKVTLIPGEGIGPEVAAAVKRILEAAGVQIEWEELEARADTSGAPTGTGQQPCSTRAPSNPSAATKSRSRAPWAPPSPAALPASTSRCARRSIFTPTSARCKNLPGVKSRFENVDVVIVRENTEDLYSGLEHEVVPGVVESLKIITEKASTRIAQFAFEYANEKRPQENSRHPQSQHHEAVAMACS